MKTREQNRNNKRTEIERFDWLSNGYQRAWLLVGEANAQEIDTSLWRHTATRLANQTMPSPYQGFLWRENEESMFWSFHPLSDKTSNEHFTKPCFKVMRKSLWDYLGDDNVQPCNIQFKKRQHMYLGMEITLAIKNRKTNVLNVITY